MLFALFLLWMAQMTQYFLLGGKLAWLGSDLFTHLSSERRVSVTASPWLQLLLWDFYMWFDDLLTLMWHSQLTALNILCNKLQGITVIFYWWAAMKCKLLKMQQACLEQCCRQLQQTGCGVQMAILHTMVQISETDFKQIRKKLKFLCVPFHSLANFVLSLPADVT